VEWQILQGRRNLADLERLMAVEQARAESLAAEISYRNSNEYIELVARRELGLVKPGEVSVMLGVNR
jgi:cell division protein FtsB